MSEDTPTSKKKILSIDISHSSVGTTLSVTFLEKTTENLGFLSLLLKEVSQVTGVMDFLSDGQDSKTQT